MSEKNQLLYRRHWLNRKGHRSIAFVCAKLSEVDIYRGKKETSASIEGNITIEDCSRTVLLDFSAYDLEEAQNALHKMSRLIRVLKKYKQAYKKEMARALPVWEAPAAPPKEEESVPPSTKENT